MISNEQHRALGEWLTEGAALAEQKILEVSADTEVELLESKLTTFAEFGDHGLIPGDDTTAGVIGRLEGALPGAALVALEPEEALLWAQRAEVEGGGSSPIEDFVSLGHQVLEGLASAIADQLREDVRIADSRLVEESVLGILVGTHAPSDTVAVCARLLITVRGEHLGACAYLLIEPKHVSRIFGALDVSSH